MRYILFLIFPLLAFGDIEIIVDQVQEDVGTTASIPVRVKDFDDVVLFDLVFSFNEYVLDTDLPSLVSNVHGSISDVVVEVISDSQVKVSWVDVQSVSLADDVVLFELQLNFCHDTITCGEFRTMSDIEFVQGQSFVYDNTYYPISVIYTDGYVFGDPPVFRIIAEGENITISGQECIDGILGVISGIEGYSLTIESGADVVMVAGQSIVLASPTVIESGALFHAYIDSDLCQKNQ